MLSTTVFKYPEKQAIFEQHIQQTVMQKKMIYSFPFCFLSFHIMYFRIDYTVYAITFKKVKNSTQKEVPSHPMAQWPSQRQPFLLVYLCVYTVWDTVLHKQLYLLYTSAFYHVLYSAHIFILLNILLRSFHISP